MHKKQRLIDRGIDPVMYALWSNLRARCGNSSHPYFKDYGGRGIGYDPNWSSFEVFNNDVLQDIGPRPGEGWSLDRTRNSEGYRRGNIRWATSYDQANNRRTARNVKLDPTKVRQIRATPGVMRDVAKQFGISPSMVAAIKRGTRYHGVI